VLRLSGGKNDKANKQVKKMKGDIKKLEAEDQ
jgi:hypothetical protein